MVGAAAGVTWSNLVSRCDEQHLRNARETVPKTRGNKPLDGTFGVTKPWCEACSRACPRAAGVSSASGKIETGETPDSGGRAGALVARFSDRTVGGKKADVPGAGGGVR